MKNKTKEPAAADIGMIGMAVMGENLSMNMERNGFTVAVYDIGEHVVDNFIAGRGKGGNFVPTHSLPEFVAAIKPPRKIMMMIRAGAPVDEVMSNLFPLLSPGDIIIDGGNSHYLDTERRTKLAESHGLLFIGTGVSGGAEGALTGPSMMPGGSRAAWEQVAPIFRKICAKVSEPSENGGDVTSHAERLSPCCDWVGDGGAGHFVKAVHNGIEYSDMQLICEAYQIMRAGLCMTPDEISAVFDEWNRGELESYLIEITAKILARKDTDGKPLIDKILDTAGQKGTGKWTGIAALELGVPITSVVEAVFSRCLSAAKEQRVKAAAVFDGTGAVPDEKTAAGVLDSMLGTVRGTATGKDNNGGKAEIISCLGNALYAAKIISYAQGYMLMQAAAAEYGWKLNLGGIALMWRGGCIIRSAFLGKIKQAFDHGADDGASFQDNLMLSPFFADKLERTVPMLRRVCAGAMLSGVPVPAMSSALCFFDGYRSARLPASLLQAQRDFFGAHTYERVDAPRGEFFHTDWDELHTTASTQYNV